MLSNIKGAYNSIALDFSISRRQQRTACLSSALYHRGRSSCTEPTYVTAKTRDGREVGKGFFCSLSCDKKVHLMGIVLEKCRGASHLVGETTVSRKVL